MRKAFQDGKVFVTYRHFLGYDRGENGELKVNPEQAKTVRMIYKLFLDGNSFYRIAAELTRRRIPTPYGKEIWRDRTVKNILQNEKYRGDALLQKRYSRNFLDRKMRKNEGEFPQYFVENTHEAIIEMDTFQKAQEIFSYNKEAGGFPYNRTGKMYPFTKKVICGRCGRHYTRQLWNTSKNGEKCPTWVCTGKKRRSTEDVMLKI